MNQLYETVLAPIAPLAPAPQAPVWPPLNVPQGPDGFFNQPTDLQKHAPELWSLEPVVLWPPLNVPQSVEGFWTQPPDLQKRPPELWTPQEHRAPQGAFIGPEPQIFWWAQAPDLFRPSPAIEARPSQADLNQTMATPSPLAWYLPFSPTPWQVPELGACALMVGALNQTPNTLGWLWLGPPTPFRYQDLAPAPKIGSPKYTPTEWILGFAGQFAALIPPGVSAALQFESQGWGFLPGAVLSAPPVFPPPCPPKLDPVIQPGPFLPNVTPKALASFPQPFLAEHPRGLFTWPQYIGPQPQLAEPNVFWWSQPPGMQRPPANAAIQPWAYIPGWRYQFSGFAPFIARRPKLAMAVSLPRYMVAASDPRAFTATAIKSPYRSPDLTPAIVAGVEQEFVTFDFGRLVAPDDGIQTAVVTCYADGGPDVAPQSRVLSPATILAAPSTGAASGACRALVGGMIAGTLYLLQAVVVLADGQKLVLEVRLPCVSAP